MYEPQFIINDENLEKVSENKDNILCIKPFNVENKKALFALMKLNNVLYYRTQLTESQSRLTFPFEPIYFLDKYTDFDFSDYVVLHNQDAFNSKHLEGFKYKFSVDKKYARLYATFNSGVATYVQIEKTKGFLKHNGIEPYVELLEEHKEFKPTHEYYKILEYYDNGVGYYNIEEEPVNERRLTLRLKNLV